MTALLIIIYLAFISLGLPDSLLGSAWPAMYEGFNAPVSAAGFVSIIIASGTILSSFFSDKLTKKFGTGPLTLISVAMTAFSLLGISFASSFAMLCIFAVPLGIGGGSVDAALNNFVALHYKASHMNWLHSFWGIGASMGPLVISNLLRRTGAWSNGYRIISFIQFGLAIILVLSQPLWKKVSTSDNNQQVSTSEKIGISQLIALPKAKPTLLYFLCYGALESTVGLWGSTYFVIARGFSKEVAAWWISLFFIGITIGRMISGFLSIKQSQKRMIELGQILIGIGVVLLIIPSINLFSALGLVFIGLGCAPIYPSLLHETPNTFGKEKSQAIMGMQMACTYLGATIMAPLFGFIASAISYKIFPYYLAIFLATMLVMIRRIYSKKVSAI